MEGIKRISDMAKGQKDYVLLSIVKYLISREDMNLNYLNEEKTLKGMASYIQGEILKDYCKRMNIKDASSLAESIKYGDKTAKCLVVGMSEERTYELAINYFSKSNKELGIKPEEPMKKEIKPAETNKQENNPDEFGSIFSIEENEDNSDKKEEIEQISIFSSILQ